MKIYDEVGPDVGDDATPWAGGSTAATGSLPMVYDPNFHELEYFVALERAPEALRAMRELMLCPASPTPSTRSRCARSAPTRPSSPRSTGPPDGRHLGLRDPGDRLLGYLRAVDELLGAIRRPGALGEAALPTPERLDERYPRPDEFIAIRRELDPEGMFLNDHLRPLFA